MKKMVSLWLDESEKEIIHSVAEKNHMSMSDVIRILISSNIKNGITLKMVVE